MPEITIEEIFRRWHLPWKERICDEVRPMSHGAVLRSRRFPDYWEFNCVRLEQPMPASEMVALADRELSDCAHRLVEWTIPMPDEVVAELRDLGWMAAPLVYMLHSDTTLPEDRPDLVEVDYELVRELRDIWHREEFGDHAETDPFHRQASEVAELAEVRVVAAIENGRANGFAQLETHDGGSEVAQVFVRPERRGAGLGRALTLRAAELGALAAPHVWICAERDDRPRRLYERLGFCAQVETGVALRLPASQLRERPA